MLKKNHLTLNDKREYLMIFLVWLAYASSYVGRYSYVSNAVVIGPYYGVGESDVGLVSSIFFIIYGIGQVVNAFFCSRYPKRYVIAGSLTLSSVANLLLFFDIPFQYIKFLWALNAAALSVLWPTLVQTISTYITKEKVKFGVFALSTTVAFGTIFAYAISGIMVQFAHFKFTFLVTSIWLIIAAVVWFIAFRVCAADLKVQSVAEKAKDTPATEQKKKSGMGLFYITFACLAMFAVANNFVKDGLNTWVPNILNDMYNLPESLSIVLTITLSLLGIFGVASALFLNRYVKDFVLMCGILFGASAILVACVLGLFHTPLWWLVLVMMGVISLFMYGVNNVILSMFTLYMPDNSKAGFYSGLLNGACYVGSATSSYSLGLIAEHFKPDWSPVFYVLLFFCCLCVVVSIVFYVGKRIALHHGAKT